MAKRVRFGIIGAGMISHFHAKAINDTEGAELVSVYNPGKKSREAFVEQHKVRGYEDIGAFLADPELDAVTIATPTGMHRDPAIAAARAGKHILCEKPLETTPERSQDIIDACRQCGVLLAPVFQYRYTPAAGLIREALAAGRFGKLLMGNARVKWYRPQSYYDSGAWRGTWEMDGGGCLMNQAVHAIDLFINFMGRPVEVYGHISTAAHERIQVEDNAVAAVKFANGAFGVIEASTACAPGWPLEVEVSGTRGTACIRGETLGKWDFADSDPMDERAKAIMAVAATNSGGASDPKAISTRGHQLIVEGMVKAITTGAKSVIDGAEAKLPIELICGVYTSVRSGMPCKL